MAQTVRTEVLDEYAEALRRGDNDAGRTIIAKMTTQEKKIALYAAIGMIAVLSARQLVKFFASEQPNTP